MRGGMNMARVSESRYVKPNLFLRGKLGRDVLRIIRNTPPQDLSHLIKNARECEIELMEKEQNGKTV